MVSSSFQRKHRNSRSYFFIINFIGLDGTLNAATVRSKDSNYLQQNEHVRVFVDPKNPKFAVVKPGNLRESNPLSIVKYVIVVFLAFLFSFGIFSEPISFEKILSNFNTYEIVIYICFIIASFLISLRISGAEDKGNVESVDAQSGVQQRSVEQHNMQMISNPKKPDLLSAIDALPVEAKGKMFAFLRKAQLLVGLTLVVVAIVNGRFEFQLLTQGHSAEGKIVDHGVKTWNSIGKNRGPRTAYTPIVEFRVGDRMYQFQDIVSGYSKWAGETSVKVLYDPKDPKFAMIKRPISNWLPWAPLLLLGLVTLVIPIKPRKKG